MMGLIFTTLRIHFWEYKEKKLIRFSQYRHDDLFPATVFNRKSDTHAQNS